MKKRKIERQKEKLAQYYDANDRTNIDMGLMEK